MGHQNSLLPKSYLAVRERTLSSWQSSDIRGVRGWAVDLPRIHSEQRCLYSAVETESLFFFLPFLQRTFLFLRGWVFPFFMIYWYLCLVWRSPGSVKRLSSHMCIHNSKIKIYRNVYHKGPLTGPLAFQLRNLTRDKLTLTTHSTDGVMNSRRLLFYQKTLAAESTLTPVI